MCGFSGISWLKFDRAQGAVSIRFRILVVGTRASTSDLFCKHCAMTFHSVCRVIVEHMQTGPNGIKCDVHNLRTTYVVVVAVVVIHACLTEWVAKF